MSLKEKLVLCGMVAATVIATLLIWGFVSPMISRHSAPGNFTSGAAGNLLIEQYDPYVQQNGGINSALPVIFSGGSTLSGANTVSGAAAFTSTFTLGSGGTALTQYNQGTTTLIGAGGSNYYQVTASTTKLFDFSCPNVTQANLLQAFFAPTTTATANAVASNGWDITYASPSSTAGICTAAVSNLSGVTATIPQWLASSTGYRTVR